jgi:orotate phosphoribosyltransferase
MSAQQRLIEILLERSVKRQKVVLASGKESDFYVDARRTTLHAEGASLIAQLILEKLQPQIAGIGGPVTGADPITGAVICEAFRQGRALDGFMVRKEPKSHGLRLWVEGRANLQDGSSVCLLEDTVTTGGSLVKAANHVRDSGLKVSQCIVVVDREEGARERLAEAGITLEALVTRRDLIGDE